MIHATAGTNSRAWLKHNPRGVSIHRLIEKDGTIVEMVPDALGANHVGGSRLVLDGRTYTGKTTPNTNQITLGIELENLNDGRDPYPTAQLDAAVWQLQEWRARYGALPIFYHRQIDQHGKTDPAGLPLGYFDARFAPVPPRPAPISPDAPILAPPRCSLAQAQRAWLRRGPWGEYTAEEVTQIVAWYWQACVPVGVDPCLAVAQMAHETDYLRSFWSARPQRNPAGLGVDGTAYPEKPANSRGFKFNTQRNRWEKGLSFGGWLSDSVPAHVGRLLAWAFPPGVGTPAQKAAIHRALAYRALPLEARGSAPLLYQLGKANNKSGYGWAAPGGGYGLAIAAIMNDMRAT